MSPIRSPSPTLLLQQHPLLCSRSNTGLVVWEGLEPARPTFHRGKNGEPKSAYLTHTDGKIMRRSLTTRYMPHCEAKGFPHEQKKACLFGEVPTR